jgi:hypothetical protein
MHLLIIFAMSSSYRRYSENALTEIKKIDVRCAVTLRGSLKSPADSYKVTALPEYIHISDDPGALAGDPGRSVR